MNDSDWMRIAEAYKEWLIDNDLAGDVVEDLIHIQKFARPRQSDFGNKAMYIFPQTERSGSSGGMQIGNGEYGVGYGFGTVLAWPSNQDLESNMDAWMLWRELAHDLLEPLDEVIFDLGDPAIATVSWEPSAIYDAASFAGQHDVQAFVMRAFVRRASKSRA